MQRWGVCVLGAGPKVFAILPDTVMRGRERRGKMEGREGGERDEASAV